MQHFVHCGLQCRPLPCTGKHDRGSEGCVQGNGTKRARGNRGNGGVIYNSLAECYAESAKEIEGMTGITYDCIHIIGGGANADYLNRLTSKATGKKVCAGPAEATAVGNLAAQMIADGTFENLEGARKCIRTSFPIKEYS